MRLPLPFLTGAAGLWLFLSGLLGSVSANPAPVLDDRYFSINNASLASLSPLDKRQDCSVNPVYCAASNHAEVREGFKVKALSAAGKAAYSAIMMKS